MKERKIKVRQAKPKDVVNIFKLLKSGWSEQTVEYAPVDDLRGFQWILGILRDGFIAVADLDGRIVGVACASPFQPPWSFQWMLDMENLYIMPQFRGEGVFVSLMNAVEQWADKVKLSMVLGITTGEKPEVKDRMMCIAGWTYTGGNYIRPFDEQQQENNKNKQHDSE